MQHVADAHNNLINAHWSIGILFWVVILVGIVLFVKSAFGGPKE